MQGIIFSGATYKSFQHNNISDLANILHEHASQYSRVLIVTEGIFSMDGDIAPLDKIIELKYQHPNVFIMIDEAHSIGVLGKTGRGCVEHFGVDPQDVDLWMGTLSKSLASCGGFIAGSHELIQSLRQTCAGFIFSAGISPANTAAALASLNIIQKEPERVTKLIQLSHHMLEQLNSYGVHTGESQGTPIIPIITGEDEKAINLSLSLMDRGIYALPIVYPAVNRGMARVRLFLSQDHTTDMLTEAAKIIYEGYSALK